MAAISFSSNGDTPFQRLLGHNADIMAKWVSLEEAVYASDTFSPELKEEVRRTLAVENGCEYCMAKGAPSRDIPDERTRMAVLLAHVAASERHIGDEHLRLLEEYFSESEIAELVSLICFVTACQRFGALLGLTPSCQIR